MQSRNRWIIAVLASTTISIFTLAQGQSRLGATQLLREELSPSPTRTETARTGAPTGVTFSFGVVDFPGVDAHQHVHQINDHGHMVGIYTAPSSNTEGYLLQGSKFKKIVYPGAGVNVTSAWGINKAGLVVGFYSSDGGSTGHGFMLKGKTFSSFDYPGAVLTSATAINAAGVIVGTYLTDEQALSQGFELSGGVFTPIAFPSSTATDPYGINAAGEIVGSYASPDGILHGFTLQGGTYTSVDYPGGIETALTGINDSGQIIGAYSDDGGATYHGFLLKDGVFTPFDVPYAGVTRTFPMGINNKNQIVGRYIDNAGYRWGFEASFQ